MVGKRAVDTMKEVNYAMYESGDSALTERLTSSLTDVLEARLYAMKFLRSTDTVDSDRTFTELTAALAKLELQMDLVDNPAHLAMLQDATADLQTYFESFETVHDLVLDRNQIVNGQLDVIGPRVAQLQHDVQVSLVKSGEEAAQVAEARVLFAEQVIAIVSVVAIALGVVACLFMTRIIVLPIRRYMEQVKLVGEGDLTQHLDVRQQDEIGDMGHGINGMIETMARVISQVQSATFDVASASTEISTNSEQMSISMNQQTHQIGEIGAAIKEMRNAVDNVAQKAGAASVTANEAGGAAKKGGVIVNETIEGMTAINGAVSDSAKSVEGLGKRGEEIGAIVAVINDIADQTNLLALNAAIEAARAGENGRGFAVVADEVRNLADRTTQATDEIAQSIAAIQGETKDAVSRMSRGKEQVVSGVQSARSAGDSLDQIVGNAGEVAAMIHGIAAATEQQSVTAEQIARNVESTTKSIRLAAEGAAQSSGAVLGLSVKAEELQTLVGQFKLAS